MKLPVLDVAEFVSALLGPRILDCPASWSLLSGPSQTLRDAFLRSVMHFNHFIKPYELAMGKTRLSLLSFLIRGAALQGENNHVGWDKLIPYLYYDNALHEQNVGFILIKD